MLRYDKPAPDFSLPDTEDRPDPITLAEFRGKDVEFAGRACSVLVESQQKEPVHQQTERRIEAIQRAVSGFFELPLDELTGAARTKQVVLPPQLATYLCRDLTRAPLPTVVEELRVSVRGATSSPRYP